MVAYLQVFLLWLGLDLTGFRDFVKVGHHLCV